MKEIVADIKHNDKIVADIKLVGTDGKNIHTVYDIVETKPEEMVAIMKENAYFNKAPKNKKPVFAKASFNESGPIAAGRKYEYLKRAIQKKTQLILTTKNVSDGDLLPQIPDSYITSSMDNITVSGPTLLEKGVYKFIAVVKPKQGGGGKSIRRRKRRTARRRTARRRTARRRTARRSTARRRTARRNNRSVRRRSSRRRISRRHR